MARAEQSLSLALAALDGIPAGARVVVAMSGGVDSSVAAAVARERGLDVVGVTLQLYDDGAATGRKGACCAGQDIHDARGVADRLGIPHYVLDYERTFRDSVIAPFIDSYVAGETPIPCVACNQTVKFRDLLQTARELGAVALITGHYCELLHGDGGPRLHRAADADRDQSYFLFATELEQLRFLRFPLGALPKHAVRDLAAHFGLPVANKPDSQDICFVAGGRYADIIERLKPEAAVPGEIVHVDGRVLGRHGGIVRFTIGQRRGLGLASPDPLYVVDIDPAAHKVIVGPREALHRRRVDLINVNWLADRPFETLACEGIEVFARVRSSQQPQAATLSTQGGHRSVWLAEGEFGLSPGQACVIYEDGSSRARVLGGGWIHRSRRSYEAGERREELRRDGSGRVTAG